MDGVSTGPLEVRQEKMRKRVRRREFVRATKKKVKLTRKQKLATVYKFEGGAYVRAKETKYGLIPGTIQKMWYKQDKMCAICMIDIPISGPKIALDHDHKTRRVRGLLCRECNLGLGHFKDNPYTCARAGQYLFDSGEGSAFQFINVSTNHD